MKMNIQLFAGEPNPPGHLGYDITLKSNDGSSTVQTYTHVTSISVTSTGATLVKRQDETDTATYTYSGQGTFAGFASASLSRIATYPLGSTITVTDDLDLYIVDNEVSRFLDKPGLIRVFSKVKSYLDSSLDSFRTISNDKYVAKSSEAVVSVEDDDDIPLYNTISTTADDLGIFMSSSLNEEFTPEDMSTFGESDQQLAVNITSPSQTIIGSLKSEYVDENNASIVENVSVYDEYSNYLISVEQGASEGLQLIRQAALIANYNNGIHLTYESQVETEGDPEVISSTMFIDGNGDIGITGNHVAIAGVGVSGVTLSGTAIHMNGNVVPITNNSFDLGSSSYKWKDFFITGKLRDGNNNTYGIVLPDTTSYSENKALAVTSDIPTLVVTTGSESVTDKNGNTLNLVTRDTVQTISGVKTFSAEPVLNNSVWLRGKNTNGDYRSLLGINSNNITCLGTTNQDTSILVNSAMYPSVTEAKDLGKSSYKWKDLYLSGNLSNGTNTVSIANIVDKVNAQSIAGAKTFTDAFVANNNVTLGASGKTIQVTGTTTITGNLTVTGDITQQGSSYETHSEKIYSTKDYIYLREGQTGGLASGSYTGFEFIKYDGTNNGRLVVDNTGVARVGDVGDEQPLATREESPTNNGFAKWNSTHSRFETVLPENITLTDTQATALRTQLDLSLTTTAGSEAVTMGSDNLNVVTRDTTQLITGTKTFRNNLNRKHSTMDLTTAPQSVMYLMDDYLDSNGTRIGVVGALQETDGRYGIYLQVGNRGNVKLSASSSGTWQDTDVRFDIPNPASAANDTRAATTKWARDTFLPLVGGTVSGQIIFTKGNGVKFSTDSGYQYLLYGDAAAGASDLYIMKKDSSDNLSYYKFMDSNGKLYSDNSEVVTLSGSQTITGSKIFNSSIDVKNVNNAYSDSPSNANYSTVRFTDSNNAQVGNINATIGSTWNALNMQLKNKSGTLTTLEYVADDNGVWRFDAVTDNLVNLGTTSRRWKNLYLSGNLTDGTNSTTISNIVTLNQAQTITGQKTFTQELLKTQTNGYSGFAITNSGYTRGNAPSDTIGLGRFIIRDSASQYLSYLQTTVNSNKEVKTEIIARQATTAGGNTYKTSVLTWVASPTDAFLAASSRLEPTSDNTFDLGTSTKRWKTVNAAQSVRVGACNLVYNSTSNSIDFVFDE